MEGRKCPKCGHVEGKYVYFCTSCGFKTEEITGEAKVALSSPTEENRTEVVKTEVIKTEELKTEELKTEEIKSEIYPESVNSVQQGDYAEETVSFVEPEKEVMAQVRPDSVLPNSKNSNGKNKMIIAAMGGVIVILVIAVIALVNNSRGSRTAYAVNPESIASNSAGNGLTDNDMEVKQSAETDNSFEQTEDSYSDEIYDSTENDTSWNDETEYEAEYEAKYEPEYGQVNPDFSIYSGIDEYYSNALQPEAYQFYNSGIADFSFWYPTNLYCDVKEYNQDDDMWNEYGHIIKEIDFFGSRGSELSFKLIQKDDGLSIDDATAYVHAVESGKLNEPADIVFGTTSDHGKVIVTGWDSNYEYPIYDLYKIEDDYYMQMEVIFPDYEDSYDKECKAYVTECYYRLCGFSDSKAGTRSFQEFAESYE